VALGPLAFQERFLKRKLTEKQREIMRAVYRYSSVSVAGCHGSGKTYGIAGLVPYELIGDQDSIVLTLAPTFRQVKTHWGEVARAIADCKINLPEPDLTQWKVGPNNYALGFSSSRGVNAQGFHGKRVLILADEAIGIGVDVWDAIEGIRSAGDVRIVKLCNPTVPSGPVYDDFTRNRNLRGHKAITISAFDTPNLQGLTLETLLALPDAELDYAPYPYLIRRRWVVEMYHKWGPTSTRFLSRVLGQFPTQASDAVFRLEWVQAAALPYDAEDLDPHLKQEGLYIQVGLDIAGAGDDETAACARIGPYVVAAEAWADADAMPRFLEFISRLRMRFRRAHIVVVGDAVGVGFHFLTALARQNFDVRTFIAGGAAVDGTKFKNAKAEAYWQLREWMRGGFVHGLEDEDTQAQLADVRYRETAGGLVEIESKDEARARTHGGSPDRAEAAIMAFLKIVPRTQEWEFSDPNFQIAPY
jgi:phage terminase large subunit